MRSAFVAAAFGAVLAAAVGCSGPLHPSPDLPPNLTSPDAAASAPSAPPHPISVFVQSIKATSTLQPLGIDPKTGEATVPDVHHPEQGGWLQVTYGQPVSDTDPIVVLAHVDGDGKPGLFKHLTDVALGDKILIGMSDGSQRTYTVTRNRTVAKAQFPTAAVYGQTKAPEIRLITCGGTLDKVHHNYLSSVIVWASLTP